MPTFAHCRQVMGQIDVHVVRSGMGHDDQGGWLRGQRAVRLTSGQAYKG